MLLEVKRITYYSISSCQTTETKQANENTCNTYSAISDHHLASIMLQLNTNISAKFGKKLVS